MQEGGEVLSPATLYGERGETALSVLVGMSGRNAKGGDCVRIDRKHPALDDHLGTWAAVYSASFQSNTQSFPYLVSRLVTEGPLYTIPIAGPALAWLTRLKSF